MACKPETIELFQKQFGTLTEAEAKVLKDVIGFLEYAIRNELPFITALGPLGHDVNGLAR